MTALHYYKKRGASAPLPVRVDDNRDKKIYHFADGSTVTDIVRTVADGIDEITRRWEIRGRGRYRLFFEHDTGRFFDDWIVPAVLYRGNEDGMGYFPRGGIDSGWEFREDRMGIPGAFFALSEGDAAGIFVEPAVGPRDITSGGIRRGDGGHVLYAALPAVEQPKRYIAKGFLGLAYGRKKSKYIKSGGSLTYERTFYVYRGADLDYYRVFRTAVDAFGPRAIPITRDTLSEQIELRRRHLAEYLYYEKDDIIGIRRGRNNGFLLQRTIYDVIGGGFLEKGIQGAYLLHRLGEEKKAEKIADFLLEGSMENGLAWVCYHLRQKKWGGAFLAFPRYLTEKIPLRPLGEMCVHYLKLYRLTNKKRYLDYVVDAGRILMEHQKDDGNFGRVVNLDGSIFDDRGTNGAYIAWMLLDLFEATGRDAYRESALKSVEYFIKKVVEEGEYLADALDSDCIDKEGGVIVMKLLIRAYEVTGDRRYIEAAASVADYVLHWVWTYDVTFDPATPLGRERFSTFAMTSVSVAHHHLDFYGAEIGVDLLKLDEYLGDDRYRPIALPMISCCFQLLNGFQGGVNLIQPEIEGWQPEQLNQTDWDMLHPRIRGGRGTYKVLIAWNQVLVLGALVELRDMIEEGRVTLP